MWPIRLVLFDLDDTLCDQTSALRCRVELAFRAALFDQSPEHIQPLVEHVVQLRRMDAGVLREVLAAHGWNEQWRVERAMQTYSANRFRGLALFPEARTILDRIQAHFRTGLITNGPSLIQRAKLVHLGLADRFPLVLISEEVGFAKPAPQLFERALQWAGVAPAEAVYVGDDPWGDIAGAQAVGIHTIWHNRWAKPWPALPPPEYEIRNLQALLHVLLGEGPDGAEDAAFGKAS